MTEPLHPWTVADRAYQLHHVGCAQCKGAGLSPGRMMRCEAGVQLWLAYRRTPPPPHLDFRQPVRDDEYIP